MSKSSINYINTIRLEGSPDGIILRCLYASPEGQKSVIDASKDVEEFGHVTGIAMSLQTARLMIDLIKAGINSVEQQIQAQQGKS